MATPIADAQSLLDSLRAVTRRFESGTGDDADLSGARANLGKLRLLLTEFPDLPPEAGDSDSARQQQIVARAAFEQACLIAVRAGDGDALDRAWAQLAAFYVDLGAVLPPSEDKCKVCGLYLLHLLVTDRTGAFLCELELLSAEERASAEVCFPANLQSWMTEGAFNRVLAAASSPPSALFVPMLASITKAVRSDVARCVERAYDSLSLADAAKMLRVEGGEEAVRRYVAEEQPDWEIRTATPSSSSASASGAARVTFPTRSSASDELPSNLVISRTLQYANDVEAIV